MNGEAQALLDTALLLGCRLLPCALLWGRPSLTGVPGWALLGPAVALVVALVPTHLIAMSCTAQSAALELGAGMMVALAGLLLLSLVRLLSGSTDEAARHRAPLWRRHLPPLLFGLWAMSGGAEALVADLDASLALYPLGQSGDSLLTAPGRLLALLPELSMVGLVICLPIAALKLAAELADGLVSRWSGHPLRPTRPLLPLAVALLLLIAASHLGDRAFRMLP